MMGKFGWIGIFVAMVAAGTAWSAPATEALIAETQAALDKGDAQHAANLADAALKDTGVSSTDRGRLLLYRGLAAELLGSHDPAMRDFTAALNTHALPAEEKAQALLQRGFLRDGLGHLDEAAKDYTAVIALKGDSLATALNNRANIYRRQNRYAWKRAITRRPCRLMAAGRNIPGMGLDRSPRLRLTRSQRVDFMPRRWQPILAMRSFQTGLEAPGGPPEGAYRRDPQDRIVLHPPQAVTPVKADCPGQVQEEGRWHHCPAGIRS